MPADCELATVNALFGCIVSLANAPRCVTGASTMCCRIISVLTICGGDAHIPRANEEPPRAGSKMSVDVRFGLSMRGKCSMVSSKCPPSSN